jgi:UDP-N-acetylglucosamine 4,6-dehydratase
MKTIIIGKKSLLTKYLTLNNKNSIVFPARHESDLEDVLNYINKSNSKVNLILNNFYPSAYINKITPKKYLNFYNQSIIFNAKLFSKLKVSKIHKIIYSSSSSVYNSIRKDYQFKDSNNRSLYSSTKIACENLIYNFASKNNILFLILRIFNMYSDKGDKFSIISKLSDKIKRKEKIEIFNQGENIRDYIHVKDVVKLINFFLKKKSLVNNVYDIGVGKGIKLIDILDYIGKDKLKIDFKKENIDETDVSIATNEYLNDFKFKSLESFFSKYKNLNKYRKISTHQQNSKNILQDIIDDYIIYGTGNAGKQVYQRLISQNQKVYCFVDDDKNKRDKTIFNKKIISSKDLFYLSRVKIIKNLIIAIPSLSKKKLDKIQKTYSKYINDISFIPLKSTLKSEIISLTDLDSFNIYNILGKKRKIINYGLFDKDLKKKNILVTGAAGSIGSQLVRQLLNTKSNKIIGYDNSEIDLFNLKNELQNFKNINLYLGDILDNKFLDYIIKKEKIDLIFHAAAYKHVGILQQNVESAIRNNIFGTENVLKTAKANNVSTITISTDKAVKPTSILGMTKRISEIICLMYNSKNFKSKVVRFGNVFGSIGSAVPTFINQINNKLPITITDKKVERYFMTLNEACFLLLWTMKLKNTENVIILNMGKSIKIIQIIENLVKLRKNLDPNYSVEIKVIGLQKGEKLKEELIINKKLVKTRNSDINISSDPIYSDEEILKFLNRIKLNSNPDVLKRSMKKFLSRDFKK